MAKLNRLTNKAKLIKPRPSPRGATRALLLVLGVLTQPLGWAAEPGITDTRIRIGGVMDLEGESQGLGLGMKEGIEAALKGQSVQGRSIEFVARNDYYVPDKTAEATKQLLNQGVFLMLGNVGTPTAKKALPILAEQKIPAVGFFTGAGLLRPGIGDIINFRASYVQEVASSIEAALASGVKPNEVCAYVQNDAYGMAGVAGVKTVLAKQQGMEQVTAKLDQVLAFQDEDPARNNIGPVGVYPRNARSVREGYKSLKNWEETSGHRCRLIVTVGTYSPVADFTAYARYKGEKWVISAVSFTGASNLKTELKNHGITEGVLMTQVVPALDSSLPLVKEARDSLGDRLGYVSLEGFIVGKMFLAITRSIKGDLTRENFLKAARGHNFDLSGLPLDFSNDNQGSDLVQLTYLQGGDYVAIGPNQLGKLFQ